MRMPSSTRWMLLSGLTIIAIGLIVYHPVLRIGFWTDDYWYIETAGRQSLPDYLSAYFDPQAQWRWYRPIQGIQWWVAYVLFGTEPLGYHLMQVLLHMLSAVILFLLTARVTRRTSLGLVAALLYITIPIYSLAIFFPAVVDPLLAPFYLLTIWFWLDYLEQRNLWRYVLSFAMYVCALLTKEVAATLPLVLVLLDRWVVEPLSPIPALAKRYALFFIALVPYGFLELPVLTRGLFTAQLGYGPGLHMISTLMYQLTEFAFPWVSHGDADWLLLVPLLLIFIYFVAKRQFKVLFLASAMLLTTLPILMFPPNIARAGRYLYLPLMGSAVAFALLLGYIISVLPRIKWHAVPFAASLGLFLLLNWSGNLIAQDAEAFEGVTRQERALFRSIAQKHPSFPPGTLLYFIDPPDLYASNIMFARYGATITSDSTDNDRVVGLHNHASTWIFYLDEDNNWREQQAGHSVSDHSFPNLPASFGDSIQLDSYELASDEVKRGESLIVLLYWRAKGPIDKDYTVFAHLVDSNGQIIAATDRQPHQGNLPTSQWHQNVTVADGIVIPIPIDAPRAKGLRLEVGLYELTTLQRAALIGADGQPVGDVVEILPIEITE
jgi:dolichyl-phosphate-mannose-protein mannosyltransferase